MSFIKFVNKIFSKKSKNKNVDIINLCLKVLIVDDATVNRYILRKYIEKCSTKLDIHEAMNGYTALDMCKENKYDIIFMDIKMPGISGIETTRLILERYPNTFIIGTTGQIERSVTKEALDVGMYKCIGKPIDVRTIKGLLDTVYLV